MGHFQVPNTATFVFSLTLRQRLGATWKWPCGIVYPAKQKVIHPGGVTLGKYEGMVQDLSTLFVNFKPWMGGLDCFCTFVAGSPGEDAWDL